MENKDKILQAAARVYAEVGFRGATTRRIATEAGVNEVTLFRIFGSKETLIGEALRCCGAHQIAGKTLLADPVDPERELTAWSREHLAKMRERRALIRKMLSEIEERPELTPSATSGPTCASNELREYLGRLKKRGLINPDLHLPAAAAMLLGTLFSDAMGRDMMPSVYPQPAEAAPRLYVRLFLAAIGATVAAGEGQADPGVRSPRTRNSRRATR